MLAGYFQPFDAQFITEYIILGIFFNELKVSNKIFRSIVEQNTIGFLLIHHFKSNSWPFKLLQLKRSSRALLPYTKTLARFPVDFIQSIDYTVFFMLSNFSNDCMFE